ncbi:hypothetical protein RUM44_003462 [Polyplax serrata]|uniref:Uncharacterized protein n=1 Tax=Polyplax serrata TaxID=468196 RepID=A0ABR1AGK6_POLSC
MAEGGSSIKKQDSDSSSRKLNETYLNALREIKNKSDATPSGVPSNQGNRKFDFDVETLFTIMQGITMKNETGNDVIKDANCSADSEEEGKTDAEDDEEVTSDENDDDDNVNVQSHGNYEQILQLFLSAFEVNEQKLWIGKAANSAKENPKDPTGHKLQKDENNMNNSTENGLRVQMDNKSKNGNPSSSKNALTLMDKNFTCKVCNWTGNFKEFSVHCSLRNHKYLLQKRFQADISKSQSNVPNVDKIEDNQTFEEAQPRSAIQKQYAQNGKFVCHNTKQNYYQKNYRTSYTAKQRHFPKHSMNFPKNMGQNTRYSRPPTTNVLDRNKCEGSVNWGEKLVNINSNIINDLLQFYVQTLMQQDPNTNNRPKRYYKKYNSNKNSKNGEATGSESNQQNSDQMNCKQTQNPIQTKAKKKDPNIKSEEEDRKEKNRNKTSNEKVKLQKNPNTKSKEEDRKKKIRNEKANEKKLCKNGRKNECVIN